MDKKDREEKWDVEFIACKHHPDRRCNRSDFVNTRARRCGDCKSTTKLDGTMHTAHVRYDLSEQRRWRMKSTRTLKRIKENRP